MRIDVAGGAYKQPFSNINPQTCINWYTKISAQQPKEDNEQPRILFPRPGLKTFSDISGDRVRGLYATRSLIYAVVDDTLYEVDSDGVATSRGTFTTGVGRTTQVDMVLNSNNELFLANGEHSYVYNTSTNAFVEISDPDFPGADNVTYLDTYALFTYNGRVYFSNLNDFLSYEGSNVFTPTSASDPVIQIKSHREHLFCFGTETIEIYINDGDSPFSRLPRSTIDYGLASANAVAQFHEGILFVGRDESGLASVYMVNTSFIIKKISTPSIDFQLNQLTNYDNISCFIERSYDGHIFCYFQLYDLGRTFVYDITMQDWHERSSVSPFKVGRIDPYDVYRIRNIVAINGKLIGGDVHSGKLLEIDEDIYTDVGQTILRERTTKIFEEENRYMSIHQLELDVNSGVGLLSGQGSDPKMLVEYSVDGGQTFGSIRTLDLGQRGKYASRAILNKLGTGRQWVMRFQVTDPVPVVINGATIRGTKGAT